MPVKEEEVFKYLDALRESAIVNMFGAAPYLMEAFNMDQQEARKYLKKWMSTFSERHKTK